MHYLCLASCIDVNQPDEVHFHYFHEPYGEWWERIAPRLRLRRIAPDRFVSDYTYGNTSLARYRYAHLADVARLQILLHEGGIYADIDTLFLRPIPEDWFSRQHVLGQENAPTGATESLCNAWIASRPGSEFCRRWLDGMADAFDGSWSNHSTLLPCRLAHQYPELISVEPKCSFYPVDHSPREINDLFHKNIHLPETAYSLHLWNHLWFDRQRTDFSHFHAGLLTVDYLLFAKTTYAMAARRFLPADVSGSRLAYLRQRAASAIRHPRLTGLTWLGQR